MNYGIAGVAGITVICALVGQIVKNTPLNNRWIPCIVGISGGILGIIGLYVMADFPAAEPLSAAAVGIVSGLAATGLHEMKSQLGKEADNEAH